MTRLTYLVAGAAFFTMIADPADAKNRKHYNGFNNGYGYRYVPRTVRYGYYAPRVYYAPRAVYYAPRAVRYGFNGGYGYGGYGYGAPYGYAGVPYGYYGGRGDYYYPRYGYRRYRYRNCNNGTGGLIVGGAAGALIGRAIDQSNGGYYRRGGYYGRGGYYYRRSDGTTGLIVGGAIGALAGRAIARDC